MPQPSLFDIQTPHWEKHLHDRPAIRLAVVDRRVDGTLYAVDCYQTMRFEGEAGDGLAVFLHTLRRKEPSFTHYLYDRQRKKIPV